MPGYYRRSLDGTIKEIKELWGIGIKSVLLFIKAPDEVKDNTGKEAWNPDGLMQRSIKAIKNAVPGNGCNDRCCVGSLFILWA